MGASVTPSPSLPSGTQACHLVTRPCCCCCCVQSLSHVWPFAIHVPQHARPPCPHYLPEFTQVHSTESVMPSNHDKHSQGLNLTIHEHLLCTSMRKASACQPLTPLNPAVLSGSSFHSLPSFTHTPLPPPNIYTYSSFTKDSGIPSLASLKAYGKHPSPHITEGGSGFS